LHRVPPRRFGPDRNVHNIDSSIAAELNRPNRRYSFACDPKETLMKQSNATWGELRTAVTPSRRAAIGTLLTLTAIVSISSQAISPSRAQQRGAARMGPYASNTKTIGDAVNGDGLLVVAQWEAKEGQADKVAGILDRFLPEAQQEAGVKLFLIGRGKDNPAQFLFYELFRDEAAFKAHQESPHFKTYIAGEALSLLAKRERAQYALI
jgi:quinol monooxygenase YgiN